VVLSRMSHIAISILPGDLMAFQFCFLELKKDNQKQQLDLTHLNMIAVIVLNFILLVLLLLFEQQVPTANSLVQRLHT